MHSLLRPRDTIKIVHFFEVDQQPKLEHQFTRDAIEERYTKDIRQRGVLGEFESFDWIPTKPMLDTIHDYLKETGPDFVAVAPRSAAMQKSNSLTEYIPHLALFTHCIHGLYQELDDPSQLQLPFSQELGSDGSCRIDSKGERGQAHEQGPALLMPFAAFRASSS